MTLSKSLISIMLGLTVSVSQGVSSEHEENSSPKYELVANPNEYYAYLAHVFNESGHHYGSITDVNGDGLKHSDLAILDVTYFDNILEKARSQSESGGSGELKYSLLASSRSFLGKVGGKYEGKVFVHLDRSEEFRTTLHKEMYLLAKDFFEETYSKIKDKYALVEE